VAVHGGGAVQKTLELLEADGQGQGRPMADQTEKRPPTQSQKAKALSGSMPKRATSVRLVDTATKCRRTAASPRACTSQWRAEAAFCMVSWVVNVLLAMTNRVVRGARLARVVARWAPSRLET